MKPKNIAFVTTFDSYEEAVDHWNKLKSKEIYGIGEAASKYFIIKNKAIDAVFEENQQEPIKPLTDEKIRELADKHLDYILYDEGEYGVEVEIIGELAFYDAIIEEINKKAIEK